MSKQQLYRFALAASLGATFVGCTTVTTPKPAGTSWTDKVGSSVKSGTSKMAALITPKKSMESAPQEATNPGPNVFVALGNMAQRNGNQEEAEAQYRKALALDANHLGALVGMAHLEDSRNNLEAATGYYQKATKKHPKDASALNDLGLCYHRRGMMNEAGKSLQKAIDLQPQRKLYRDNLAAVLVDQDKNEEALVHLVAAHGEAVGNYNLAYLLTQKHKNGEALAYFRKAAEKDPTLTAAQSWIAQLSGGPLVAQHAPRQPVMMADGRHEMTPGAQNGSAARLVSNAPLAQPPVYAAPPMQAVRPPAYVAQNPAPQMAPRTTGVQLPQSQGAREGGSDAPMPEYLPISARLPNVPPSGN